MAHENGGRWIPKKFQKDQSRKCAMTAPLHRPGGLSQRKGRGVGFTLGLDMDWLHLLELNHAQIRFGL